MSARDKIIGSTVIALFLFAVISGCAQQPGPYGQPLSDNEVIPIKIMFASPEDYKWKSVKVAGKITRQCPLGWWLDLTDDTGTIYVDLNAYGFVIPQLLNHSAVVEGVVKTRHDLPVIFAKGVEIE